MPSCPKSSIRSESAASTASCSTWAYRRTSWPTPRAGLAFKADFRAAGRSTCVLIPRRERPPRNFSRRSAKPSWQNCLSNSEKSAPAARLPVPSSPGAPRSLNGRLRISSRPSRSRCPAGRSDVTKFIPPHGSFKPCGLPSITSSNISDSFWPGRSPSECGPADGQ
jgi:hypothetical protein